MTTTKNRTPTNSEPGAGLPFVPQPKHVMQWLEQLPRGHVGETGRQVFNALIELNRTNLGGDVRFAIVEILAEPVNYVVSALKKHFYGKSFPLSEKSTRTVSLILTMNREMGNAYRHVLEAHIKTGGKLGKNSGAINAAYRSAQYFSEVLNTCYLAYRQPPQGIWRDIHRIYEFAASANLNSATVTVAIPAQLPDTVTELYKHTLLMALVNPYQLSQENIEAVARNAKQWVTLCTLSNEPTPQIGADAAPSIFVVDSAADNPPRHASYCELLPAQALSFDTESLTQELKSFVADNFNTPASAEQTIGGLGIDTLKRLVVSWGLASKRSFRRRRSSAKVPVTIGIGPISQFISGGHPETSDLRNQEVAETTRARFTTQSVPRVDGRDTLPDFFVPNVGAMLLVQRDKSTGLNQSQAPQTLESEGKPNTMQTFYVTNESAAGYCLMRKENESGVIKVGDLICVHAAADNLKQYNICVVRWLRNAGDMLVVGVEILAPHADAVSCSLLKQDGSMTDYTAGLLFPPISAINRPAMLLTSTMYRVADTASLRYGVAEGKIKLGKLHQIAPTFKQFEFQELDRNETDDDPNEFDSLWSSL